MITTVQEKIKTDYTDLIRAVKCGNKFAETKFYHRLLLIVKKVLRTKVFKISEAELLDMAHDVTVKIFLKLNYFKEGTNFESWVWTICFHHAVDMERLNGKKRRMLMSSEDLEREYGRSTTKDVEQSPQEILEHRERTEAVEHLINLLPEIQRKLLLEKNIKGKRLAEISAETGMKIVNISNYLFRAKSWLREKVKSIR